jgi:hypothetical protein
MAGKKKQTTLTLSFKDEEMWIYEEIASHSAKGGWVKDVLAEYIRGNQKSLAKEDCSQKKKVLDF